jgi:ubiquinone/menaquinone biosynthesis C-methylase UbiE
MHSRRGITWKRLPVSIHEPPGDKTFIIESVLSKVMSDSVQRFSVRAGAYSLYRPSYPAAVAEVLQRECGLQAGSQVADIGCGTGLLAEVFLNAGCHVIGVEPNAEMRQAGERQLSGYGQFRSIDGRAEATGLPDASVDFVTAGQAFHWFDAPGARTEFMRILRPDGWLVLVWNERPRDATGFQSAYADTANRYAPELNRIREESIDTVFGGRNWRLEKLPNQQRLDRAGLVGRLSSTSYAPVPGTPEHDEMEQALFALFDRYEEGGSVTLLYETLVYFGRLRTA